MPSLQNIDGRSLVANLDASLRQVDQFGDRRRADKKEAEEIELTRIASGLAPAQTGQPAQPPQISQEDQTKAGGFLRKISPGFADALSKVHQSRDPEAIDKMRADADRGRETADQILAAPTQVAKQAIILKRAEEIRQEGGDTRALLKQAGNSPAAMDLQAQKAKLTSQAALRALPAPTEAERLSARAALSVRNPQAFAGVLRDEKITRDAEARRQAIGRAAGSKAAALAKAQGEIDLVNQMEANLTGAGTVAASTPQEAVASAPVPPTATEQSTGGPQNAIAVIPTNQELAAAPIQADAPPVNTLAQSADDVRTAQGSLEEAVTNRNSQTTAAGIKAADTIVKRRTDALKSQMAEFKFETDAAEAFPDTEAAGNPQVRSSEILDDGSVISVTDAGVRVTNPAGEVVTGSTAANVIQTSKAFGVEQQRLINKARETGKLKTQAELGGEANAAKAAGTARIKMATDAFASSNSIQTNIRNIDSAIAAIDAGARTGAIQKRLIDVTEASAALTNSLDKMGLDVIQSTTFGALSAGEMQLAMQTAAPRDLDEVQLRSWLVKKRDAQIQVSKMLTDAATFLTTPGNTINSWVLKNVAENEARHAGEELQFFEGQTATNANGETRVYRSGQWEPQ